MTERERLINLLQNVPADFEGNRGVGTIADFLLDNGVIVPSVKVCERRIDDLGRIHIPKDVRQSLDINYGDVMSIIVSDASIILRKEREENG